MQSLKLAELPDYPTLDPIYIRRLSYKERIQWERDCKKADSEPTKMLCVKTLCDAEGKPKFTAEQIDDMEAPLVLTLWWQSGAWNYVDGDDVAALKNACQKLPK